MARNTASPIRVLYVEDDRSLQATISQMLKILGYEVVCADNGKLGVEKAESWQPDIILMDVRMPIMDGLEATQRIRAQPSTANIPIFVLSAYTDSRTRNASTEAGANKFYSKPPNIRKIDMDIKAIVNNKRR